MCQNRMLRSNQLITSTPKLLRKFHSSKTSSVLRRPSSNEQQITERLVSTVLGWDSLIHLPSVTEILRKSLS
jgi:hypothetical protein